MERLQEKEKSPIQRSQVLGPDATVEDIIERMECYTMDPVYKGRMLRLFIERQVAVLLQVMEDWALGVYQGLGGSVEGMRLHPSSIAQMYEDSIIFYKIYREKQASWELFDEWEGIFREWDPVPWPTSRCRRRRLRELVERRLVEFRWGNWIKWMDEQMKVAHEEYGFLKLWGVWIGEFAEVYNTEEWESAVYGGMYDWMENGHAERISISRWKYILNIKIKLSFSYNQMTDMALLW